MGDTPISMTGAPSGATPIAEGFNHSKADRDGARNLVLELPPLSGGHLHFGTCERQGFLLA